MPGLDAPAAIRWVISRINSDATLLALIAGGQVYRDLIPTTTEVKEKPGLVISEQSSTPRAVPLRRGGPRHHTDVVVQTRAVMQSNTYPPLEAVLNRVCALLDGQFLQVAAEVSLYECTQGIDQAYATDDGGITYKNMLVLWNIKAKRN